MTKTTGRGFGGMHASQQSPGIPPRLLHTSANASLDPLILQLIRLICREHILPWYSAISRDPDRAFVHQVTLIFIHVVQALEVRVVQADWVELLLLDLPSLLQRHVEDWNHANEKAGTGHAHNYSADEVFHLLQPHIAVSLTTESIRTPPSTTPGGPSRGGRQQGPVVDKTYLRALVDNLLRLLLPPEDYRAETERYIVREVIVNIVFGGIIDRVCQPWFLHQLLIKLLNQDEPHLALGTSASRRREGSWEDLGDVSVMKESTAPRSYDASSPPPLLQKTAAGRYLESFYSNLSASYFFFRAIIASLVALYYSAIASHVPERYRGQPLILQPSISFLITLLPPSKSISQIVHYVELPLLYFSSIVTSLIFYLLGEHLLHARMVKVGLEIVTRSLFPEGHPPPKVPDPTEEEQILLKEQCEEAVAVALPRLLPKLTIPSHSKTSIDKIAEDHDRRIELAMYLLRPISSHVANVHLILLLVDLVIGKLFPELLLGAGEF